MNLTTIKKVGFLLFTALMQVIILGNLAFAKDKIKHKSKVLVSALIWSIDGSLLLLQRVDNYSGSTNGKEMWDFPGGTVSSGEDLNKILSAEVKAEAGIDLNTWCLADSVNFETTKKKTKTYRTHIFYEALAGSVKDIHLSEQHNNFKWVKPSEFLNLNILEPFKKVLLKHQAIKNLKCT